MVKIKETCERVQIERFKALRKIRLNGRIIEIEKEEATVRSFKIQFSNVGLVSRGEMAKARRENSRPSFSVGP